MTLRACPDIADDRITWPRFGAPSGKDADATTDIGTCLGHRFSLQHVIGEGGTAVVYDAIDTATREHVAVKVLRRGLESDKARELVPRFLQEAHVSRLFDSPHLPRIFRTGRTDDGRPFMVMQRLYGQTLAQRLEAGLFSVAQVTELARQLLIALRPVHQAGVVHRDIKPQNVMLEADASLGARVVLLDFGICKRAGERWRDLAMTGSGTILGTPTSMAPEQLCMEPTDARTDIYAVGVLIYEALTGRPAFEGRTLLEVSAAILRDRITLPTQLRADCPPALEALILRAAARNPAERFSDAQDMLHAVEALRRELEIDERSTRLDRQAAIVLTVPPPTREHSQITTRLETRPQPRVRPLAAAGELLIRSRARSASLGTHPREMPAIVVVPLYAETPSERVPTAIEPAHSRRGTKRRVVCTPTAPHRHALARHDRTRRSRRIAGLAAGFIGVCGLLAPIANSRQTADIAATNPESLRRPAHVRHVADHESDAPTTPRPEARTR